MAKERGADIFVSIHHDSVNPKYLRTWTPDGREQLYSDLFEGFSLFVSQDNSYYKQSLRLAETVGRQLKSSGFKHSMHHAEPIPGENRKILRKDIGVFEAPFVVVRAARLPALLFEVGVIVHRQEEALLEVAERRQRIAEAMLNALEIYCESVQQTPVASPGEAALPR